MALPAGGLGQRAEARGRRRPWKQCFLLQGEKRCVCVCVPEGGTRMRLWELICRGFCLKNDSCDFFGLELSRKAVLKGRRCVPGVSAAPFRRNSEQLRLLSFVCTSQWYLVFRRDSTPPGVLALHFLVTFKTLSTLTFYCLWVYVLSSCENIYIVNLFVWRKLTFWQETLEGIHCSVERHLHTLFLYFPMQFAQMLERENMKICVF